MNCRITNEKGEIVGWVDYSQDSDLTTTQIQPHGSDTPGDTDCHCGRAEFEVGRAEASLAGGELAIWPVVYCTACSCLLFPLRQRDYLVGCALDDGHDDEVE